VTALMTGRLLASLRQHPVAAIDLNAPARTTIHQAALDVISPGQALEPADYEKLAEQYPLTIVDPAPAGLTRVLDLADQLAIVAPSSPEAASSLANTQEWLDAHGYSDLAARAVTVLNGVRKQTMSDVLRAESVARGRCRAIVRVPWDEQLTTPPKRPQTPQTSQTRLAYTALAGVLIAGMAAPAAAAPKESR
jgi:MinD-like ATPase involved in chromosome partitioning or flagellar assembly